MSDECLPTTVITQKLASKNAELNGVVVLSQLPRLAAALASSEGEAHVRLRFAIDDQGRRRLQANVSSELHVVCQRCLKPMPLVVDSKVEAVLVADDEAAQQVPRELDLVVAEEGILNTYEFIEDELLLCLPFTSYHEYNCVVTADDDASLQQSEINRPFADLANIMKKS